MRCAFCEGDPPIAYYAPGEAGSVVCGGCGREVVARRRPRAVHPVEALLDYARRAGFGEIDEAVIEELRRACDEPATFFWFEERAPFGPDEFERMRALLEHHVERDRIAITTAATGGYLSCRRCGELAVYDDLMRADRLCASCRSYEVLTGDEIVTVKLHFDMTCRGRDEFMVTARSERRARSMRWGVPVKLGAGNE
jgi:hypothetical protein